MKLFKILFVVPYVLKRTPLDLITLTKIDFYLDTPQRITRMSFSWRPTSRLPIESQTLTIWPWNDLDLGMTLTSNKSNQIKLMSWKLASSVRGPGPWPNDPHTQTWPRYGQDLSPYQKSSFYVNSFKTNSLNRQTDRHTDTQTDTTKTLPLLHTREVKTTLYW